MDSEKDDLKMNSSGNSFNKSGGLNMSPVSKRETNKYVEKTNIVHEEDAMEAKSNEVSQHHSRVMDENEDQFSENESTYEVKVKMMEPEINNTLYSRGSKEGEHIPKPINFKVQIDNKSPKKMSDKEKDSSMNGEKSERSHQSQHSKSDSQHSKNSQKMSHDGKGKLKDISSKNLEDEEIQNSEKSEGEGEDENEDELEMDQMDEDVDNEEGNQIQALRPPHLDENQYEDILEWYQELRKEFNSSNPWEDLDYPSDVNLFGKDGDFPERFREKDYTIEFVRLEDESEDNHFFSCERSTNIEYQFNLKRGIMSDKFFIGAVLMLFRKKEQFLTNLVLDYQNIVENLKAGFCGFTFFINGEWRTVTIDTNLPWYQADEMALSIATSNKTSFWLCLLEKAYAKIHKTYDVLNDVSVKNTLVDLTGGISKKISIKEKMDDSEKKGLFDEIKRCIQQKYLVGSMKFDLTQENPDDSKSDQGEEDDIMPNCIYNILDIQEVDGYRLIYLVNYWNRGKWNKDFGPDDEAWETNKGLKEKLEYEVVTDGTFWMRFEDWLQQFNTLYYCRIFPENWSQFCIPGQWAGISSGGAPPRNTGQPWVPERPSEDGKGGFSPHKTGGLNHKTQSINQKNTLNNKSSFSSPVNKDSSGMSSIKKKTDKSTAFKFNLLPAVDEDGEHHEQDAQIDKRGSVLTGKYSVGNRQSVGPQSTLFNSKKKSVLQPTLNSLGQASTTNIGSKNMLNQTSVSSFKTSNMNQGAVTKSQLYKVPADELKTKETFRRVIIQDTEDRWFLNPQFKLELRPGNKLIISLMQEDERISDNPYQRCNFMIILTVGRYTRVWDIKEDNIIKRASENEERKTSREILVHLEYAEILRKISIKRKKKLLAKGDKLYINVVPYLEYYQKYEVEKIGNSRNFKPISKEGIFWLRIFSNDDIYVSELAKPYEIAVEYEWTADSSGGARYIRDIAKNKIVENPHWPINPQYLLRFEKNIQMKLILRKTTGRFGEEEKVGMILTKPNYEENITNLIKKEKPATKHSFNKNDQILRVIESTDKILESKKIRYDDISRKLAFNSSEWVVESSYSNNYVASIFTSFNKIDSPIMLLPTLDNPETPFNFKLSIYSNRRVELFSLNSEDTKVLISEWKDQNAGGCHLVQDEKRHRKEDDFSKKVLSWFDNPKFHISFEYKDRLPEIEFEIIISRSETIWKKKVANSIVNSMLGVYIFKYDKEKWKEQCVNMDRVDFIPKNEILYKFTDTKVDPKGYIIMPSTFGQNIHGPFTIMIKCKAKFTVVPFNPKKIIE